MKIIKDSGIRSRHIITPWLSTAEAAKYCGLSDNTFLTLRKKIHLPCTQTAKTVRYHTADLDAWMKTIPPEDAL